MDKPSYKELNDINRINKLKKKHRVKYNTTQCFCHSRGTKKVRRVNKHRLSHYNLNNYQIDEDNWLIRYYNSHWTLYNNHRGCTDFCSLHIPKFCIYLS